LPLRRLQEADNLHVAYRPDVVECAIGPRTGMMVVAAICEHQESDVADIIEPVHEMLAVGIRRAAALGGPLPGAKLLALLKANEWDGLLELGAESKELHYLPRGRRSPTQAPSGLLSELDKRASDLLLHPNRDAGKSKRTRNRRSVMAYDVEIGEQQLTYDSGRRTLQRNTAASPKDLGVIVTLLEVAALSLTTEPESTFTIDELIREAQDIGGNGIQLDRRDVEIVLKKATFLKKMGKGFCLR
jgi:hypothetical protein